MPIRAAREIVATDPPDIVEGNAWCVRCERETGYGLRKIEFLGNPVKASFFCTTCGGRMHPEGLDRASALRLYGSARRLRWAAAGSFILILLFPLMLFTLVVYFLWRLI
jgi:hypothetical protein